MTTGVSVCVWGGGRTCAHARVCVYVCGGGGRGVGERERFFF